MIYLEIQWPWIADAKRFSWIDIGFSWIDRREFWIYLFGFGLVFKL